MQCTRVKILHTLIVIFLIIPHKTRWNLHRKCRAKIYSYELQGLRYSYRSRWFNSYLFCEQMQSCYFAPFTMLQCTCFPFCSGLGFWAIQKRIFQTIHQGCKKPMWNLEMYRDCTENFNQLSERSILIQWFFFAGLISDAMLSDSFPKFSICLLKVLPSQKE